MTDTTHWYMTFRDLESDLNKARDRSAKLIDQLKEELSMLECRHPADVDDLDRHQERIKNTHRLLIKVEAAAKATAMAGDCLRIN